MTDSLSYLLVRLELLRARVGALVERRGAGDPSAEDPFRGLYVSPDAAMRAATSSPPEAARDPEHDAALAELEDAVGGEGRVHRLAAAFGLTDLDVEILLAALAPDVDRSFEPLYGYLNDDVSRRRATVALALDLSGHPAWSVIGRARFAAGAPLVEGRLIVVEDPERPFPGRALRVPDRVAAYLLGDDAPDGELADVLVTGDEPAGPPSGELERLAVRLRAEPLLVYLKEDRPGAGAAAARSVLTAAGRPVLCVDPARLEASLVPSVLREARLTGAGVVAGPIPDGTLVRAFAGADVPVLLTGAEPFDPAWSDRQPLVLEVTAQRNAGAWRAELPEEPGFDLAAATAAYRFDAGQIRRAVQAALAHAELEGVPLTAAHLHRGARLQNAAGLHRHARRVRPDVGWDDIVLPDEPRRQLHELIARARHRDRVLGEWRLRPGGGRGRGVVAMFAGESGTGKTLAGEVVAGELGLDLYVVELSAVVDKYVGETEKNLDRIFTEAGRLDAVLLFDEADAVFGKRSEVKDARDRYANMESAFLLQRLESFDGIALLTTNLRANIDDAFTRRLDIVVDFPFPDPVQRRALWEHCLTAPVPCDDDLDLERCAREFELAGGAIRGAVVTAAYLAAEAGRPVGMEDLLAGARREYRKMGRLLPGEWA